MGEVDVASLIKQRLKNDVRAFGAAEVSEITVEVNFFCVFAIFKRKIEIGVFPQCITISYFMFKLNLKVLLIHHSH